MGGWAAEEGHDAVHVSSGCLEHTENGRRAGVGAREQLEARGLMGDSLSCSCCGRGWGGDWVSRELSRARGFDGCP